MTPHKKGSWSHDKVQHASGQDRDVRMLPRQRLGKAEQADKCMKAPQNTKRDWKKHMWDLARGLN